MFEPYTAREQAVGKAPSLPRLRTRLEVEEVAMEGYLLIPPDKGTIIGRAIWKVLSWANRRARCADWSIEGMLTSVHDL
jgi:hypothetical protein